MKNFWLIVALLASLLPFKLADANEDVVTLAVGEWAPFISESLPGYGPVLEIVRRAFDQEGIVVEYKFMPWKRAKKMSQRAKFDGTAVWGFSDERAIDFHFTDVVLVAKDSIYFSQSSLIGFDSAEDFIGLRTRILLGSYIGDAFAKLVERDQLIVHESKSYKHMFEMLLGGRIDFVYLGDYVGKSVLEKEFSQEQRAQIVSRDAFTEPYLYYMMIPKQDENGLERVDVFNRGLQKLRESGEYDQIIKKAYQQN